MVMKKNIRNYGMASAQPRINQKNVNQFPIIIPPKEFIDKFDELITPMIDSIFSNAKENRKISNLRDWLLPMLMNG